MKKCMLMLTAAFLLSSCALQDKGGVGPGVNEENDKVLSVEQPDTIEVTALYEDYEELQGKQIGEHIIMPDVIEPQEINNVYTFRLEDNFDTTNFEQRGIDFFKRYFGDRFNADRLYDDTDLDNGFYPYYLTYNYDVDVFPEGIYDPNNKDYGTFVGYPLAVAKTDAWYIFRDVDIIAKYDPKKDKDVELELEEGKCTVGDLCDTILDFYDREFVGFEGLNVKVVRVTYYSDTDDGKPVRRAFAECALEKEGIPTVDWFTPYHDRVEIAGGYKFTYYTTWYSYVTLNGKDNIITLNGGFGPMKATSVNKVENLIPLKTAAELLDENVAEKLLFRITKVGMYYCQKTTTYCYDDEVDLPMSQTTPADRTDYRPTWMFEFEDGRGSLNVDAITGEITIDASQSVIIDMHNEQRK